MRISALLAGLGMIVLGACGDDGGVNGGVDAAPSPDAPTGTPDAAPGDPDAGPGAPDAAPGDPDATPGTPDALVSDAAPPDALLPDALVPGDAGVQFGCAPTGDYVEMNEATNDTLQTGGSPEDTGLTIAAGGSPFTIGGCADPDQATGGYADSDDFEFQVTGTDFVWLTVDVTSPQGALADDLIVAIYDATDPTDPVLVDGAELVAGTAVVAPMALPVGTYWLEAFHPDTTLAGLVTYQATVSVLTCEGPAVADYTEASDGLASRGNDMVAVTYSPFDSSPTAVSTDSAEQSGVTGNAGDERALLGNTAMVTSAGDAYLDRDTFRISTGPGVDRLIFIVGWDDPGTSVVVDMDLFLFPAGMVQETDLVAAANQASTVVEFGGAVVEPETDYWLWLGTYASGATLPAGGTAYGVTVCYH